MSLFDLKYVRIVWDDELSGKLCFLGKSVADLQIQVEGNSSTQVYVEPGTGFNPFKNVACDDDDASAYYQFCYYDPDYDSKAGFKFVTNKQLSEWLAKGNGEVLFNEKVTTHWDYNLEDELKPVQQGLMIKPFGTPVWCKVTSKSIGLSS